MTSINREELKSSIIIQNKVKEFNDEVTKHSSYNQRKLTLKTPVIFFDDHMVTAPEFKISTNDWCHIPSNMISYLENSENEQSVIRFDNNEESKLLNNKNFKEECNSEIPELLKSLVLVYLKLYFSISYSYQGNAMIRIKNKINELNEKLEMNPHIIIDRHQIVFSISKEIKEAKRGISHNLKPVSFSKNRIEKIQLMLSLRKEGTLTVKEICKECKLSPSTYYLYCRREDRKEWESIKPRGRQYNENSLNENEKKCIKSIADDPKLCYTVPQMCNELYNRFHRRISKKKVYTYLSKGLGYSFKFNSYSAPPAFEPVQNIIRFKIAKKLIEFYSQDKALIFLDETGIDLALSGTRSYSKKGTKPYRMGYIRSKRLNIIMAITKDNIFCYQVTKGTISEFDFINLIISLVNRISNQSNRTYRNMF